MGISAASIGEIRATGSTTNGGYYDGTIANAEADMSQQDSGVAFTFTSSGAGNVITVTSGNASDLKIGNGVCITGGTNVNQGFYQITARSGNDLTLSTNKGGGSVASGAAVSGTGNCGGAFKLGATTANRDDDAFLEAVSNSGGSTIHVKGSHTTASAISLSATGTGGTKHRWRGYGTTRNDKPSIASGNQPLINYSSNALTWGSHWELEDCRFTGTSAAGVAFGAVGKATNCEFINTSGTANRAAVTHGNTAINFIGCKFSSTNGYAVVGPNTNGGAFFNCYFHDSVSGYRPSAGSGGIWTFLRCIFDNISTAALDFSVGAPTGQHHVLNCTFYGNETPAGTAYSIASSSTAIHNFLNNIVYGWTNGVNSGSAISEFSDFNIFNNCTTARTNWSTGSNDLTSNPNFVDAPNGDFRVGTNAQRVGYPSSIPGGLTSQIMNIGAVNSDYSSWYTDIPVSKVLTSQGDFKYNSISNNRTPTYADTNLTDANVRDNVSFGVSGNGNLVVPAADDVREGTAVDNTVGTLAVPNPSDVRAGVNTDDTIGTCEVPSPDDVRFGVDVDNTTGLVVVPLEADVKHGVDVDIAGAGEYRGEDLYDPVAANELKIGVTKNQDGESILGTYAATERYTDVPEAKVDNLFEYRYNSLTNNRTGESTGATVVLDVLTEAILESDDQGAIIEAY